MYTDKENKVQAKHIPLGWNIASNNSLSCLSIPTDGQVSASFKVRSVAVGWRAGLKGVGSGLKRAFESVGKECWSKQTIKRLRAA